VRILTTLIHRYTPHTEWDSCNKNQHDALFILNLFRHSTSTCFGHVRIPPSGGILYIHSNWYALCFSVGYLLVGQQTVNWKTQHVTTVVYTGCPTRNVPDFGRVFLMLKYTDITQNNNVQIWTVTEIMTRERCGLLAGPRTVRVSWQSYHCPSLSVVSHYGNSAHASRKLYMYFLQADNVTSVLGIHVSCIVLGTLRTTMTWVRVFL
jgi:hypothetical protein